MVATCIGRMRQDSAFLYLWLKNKHTKQKQPPLEELGCHLPLLGPHEEKVDCRLETGF